MSATLYINVTSSRCGECGRGANPSETYHATEMGYYSGPRRPGCGVTWTHVSSDYVNVPGLYESAQKMRPDLTWVDPTVPRAA